MSIGLRLRQATYDAAPPDLSAFVGRPPPGDRLDPEQLQAAPPARPNRARGRMARRVVSMVIALPMMVASVAHAAPPEGAVPDAPAPKTPAPEGPTPQRPSHTPTTAPITPPTADQTRPENAPTPSADAGLALTGTSLWTGLEQREVRLVLAGERQVAGVLLSQSATQLAVAESTRGEVVAVDKADIVGVEVVPRRRIVATSDGTGLLAGGGILLALGVPTTIAGLVFTAFSPFYGLMFLPGPFAVGAGIPMVIVGSHRRRDYRSQFTRGPKRRLGRLTPDLRLGRQGAAAGVTWRF